MDGASNCRSGFDEHPGRCSQDKKKWEKMRRDGVSILMDSGCLSRFVLFFSSLSSLLLYIYSFNNCQITDYNRHRLQHVGLGNFGGHSSARSMNP